MNDSEKKCISVRSFMRGSSEGKFRARIALVLAGATVVPALRAQSSVYINATTGGVWSTSSLWQGGVVADGANSVADFSTLNLLAANTVTLDSARTVGGLRFGDTAGTTFNWTLGGTAVLTLSSSVAGAIPFITVNNGTASITAPLSGTQGFIKDGAGTLSLGTAGTWTGNAVVNSGAITLLGTTSATSGFVLKNGTTFSTNQGLVATNIISAYSGDSRVEVRNTGNTTGLGTFNASLAGNGNITWSNFTTAMTTVSTATLLNNFGGTLIWGSSFTPRVVQSTGGGTFNANFATIDFAATGGAMNSRNAAIYVLGGLAGTGNSGVGGSTNGGATAVIVGSANSNTSYAGRIDTGSSNPTFTKVGIGTLTLNPTATYAASGAINVNGGVLRADYANVGAVFNSASPLNFAGGSLYLLGKSTGTTTQTLGAVTVNAGGGSLVIDPNGGTSTTLAVGTLTATQAGSALNISAGPGAGIAATTTTTNKLADGTYGGRITYGQDWATTDSTATPYLLAPYAGYTAFVNSGASSATNYLLSGSSSISASQTVNSLKINSTAADQSLDLGTNTLTLANGGLLFAGSANYSVNGGVLSAANSAPVVRTVAGATTVIGSDIITVASSANVFPGDTITGGGIPAGSTVVSVTPTTITISAPATAAATVTVTVTNSINDLVVHQLGTGNLTIGSVIANGPATSGVSTFTKAGTGSLTLTGANTYTGTTFIDGGTLSVSSNNNLGAESSGATIALNGGTLQATSTFGLFNGAAGTNNRNVTIGGGGGTFNVTSGNTLTVAGTVSTQTANEFGPLIKTGNGTLTLAGSNTYGGATIISGGTLSTGLLANGGVASGIGSSNSSAPALILDGGTLAYTGGTVSTDRTFTLTQNGGALDASGSGAVTFSNTLPGAYRGSGNRTLTLAGSNTGNNTLATDIMDASATTGASGVVSVTKTGEGKWVLSNSSSYTGATTINGGTLALTAASANPIAKSASIAVSSGSNLDVSALTGGGITLAPAQVLSGSGTVVGKVSTGSGSQINPGSSGVGTLVVGSLASGSGAIFNYEFSSSANDLINVTGSNGLTLNGGGFNLYKEGTAAKVLVGGTYNLFQFNGTLTGLETLTSGSILNQAAGYTYTFGSSGNFVTLTIAPGAFVISAWSNASGGSWSTSGNWDNGIPNATGATAIFGGLTAPATVTLDGNKSVAELELGGSQAFTITQGSGGSIIMDGGSSAAAINDVSGSHSVSAPISLASNTTTSVTGAGDVLTLSGVISGPGQVTKTGNGTLSLSGANTYAGGTTLVAGTLDIKNNTALGSSALTVSSNGTVRAGADSLDVANPISIGNGVVATVATQANTLTLSGNISSQTTGGGLNKTGSGTLVLTGTNTYTGGTSISAGTLQIGANGTAGSLEGPIVNNSQLSVSRSDSITVSSVISGTGSLNITGSGNVILSGVNTFSGNTSITSGVLTLAESLALQNSTLVYNPGGSLNFGLLTAATLGGLAGTQDITLSNAAEAPEALTLTVGQNTQNTSYAGALLGTGSLVKVGGGNFSLTGASVIAGNVAVNGGTAILEAGGSLSATSIFPSGGTFRVNGGALTAANGTVGSATGSGVFVQDSGTSTFTGTLATGSADGSLIRVNGGEFTAAAVSLVRTGSVSTTVGPDATGLPPGAINQNAGFVVTGGVANLGALNIGNGASAANSSSNSYIGGGVTNVSGLVTLGWNSNSRWSYLQVAGGVFNAADIAIGRATGAGSIASELYLTGGITNAARIGFGTATDTLGGAANLAVSGGSLYVGSGGIVNANTTGALVANIFLNSGLVGSMADFSSALPMQLLGANFTFKAADSADVAHNITLNGTLSGAGGLVKTGNGILALNGSNTYAGGTTLTSGTLQIGNAAALGSGALTITGNGSVSAGAANLTLSTPVRIGSGVTGTIDSQAHTLTVASVSDATANGALAKAGSGTLILTGANTYTGGTTVNAGTLRVANTTGSATGTGAVVVNSDGHLDGTGVVAGAVTVNSGGHLGTGIGGGSLTLGSLTLTNGSVFDAGFGAGNQLVNITGLLTLSGTANINLALANTNVAWTIPGTYDLFTFGGGLTGTTASLAVLNPQPGLTYQFNSTASTISLVIGSTSVNSSWVLTGGGSWANASAWSGDTPNGIQHAANFTSAITAPALVTLDGDRTIGRLLFSSTNAYTIGQGTGGTLILQDLGSSAATVNVVNGSHTITAPVALNSSAGITVVQAQDSLTVSGVVSGANSIAKNGSGTLELSGNNTYAGGTTLNGGTLKIGSSTALGAGGVNVAASSTLAASAASLEVSNNVTIATGTAATIDTAGQTLSLTGTVSDAGALVKVGNGTLVLKNTPTYTGGTTISAGTLQIGDGTSTSGSLTGSIVNNGTLAIAAVGTDLSTLDAISGTGGLIKLGNGTTSLAATNTFSGTTTVNNGTLVLTGGLSLQNSTLNYNNQGGVISFGTLTNATLANISGSQGLALENASSAAVEINLGGTNQSAAYSGALTGAGAVVKNGTGTLSLTGTSSYAGRTLVNAGTLSIDAGGSLTSGAVTANGLVRVNGGSLTSAATATVNGGGANGLLVSSGTASFTGTLQSGVNDGGLIKVDGGALDAGVLALQRTNNSVTAASTTSGLVITGGVVTVGELRVATTNSSASVSISGGSLTANTATIAMQASGGRGGVIAVSGGSFTVNDTIDGLVMVRGTNQTANLLLTGGVTTLAKLTFGGDANVLAGSFANVNLSGTASLYLGSGGIEKRALDANMVSTVNLNGGTLGAAADLTISHPLVLGAGALPVIKAADASDTAHNITLNGVLSGTGGFTKTGAGTLTIKPQSSVSVTGNTELDSNIVKVASTAGITVDMVINTTAFDNPVRVVSINPNGTEFTVSETAPSTTAFTFNVPVSSANTYSGNTVVQTGTLILANTLALQNSTLDVSSAQGSVSFSDLVNVTLGGLMGNQSIALQNSSAAPVAVTFGGNNSSSTYSGALTGAGSITKVGTGTIVLEGQNTYTGSTAITGGTLAVYGGTAPASIFTVSNSARLAGNGNIGGSVTINAGATLQPGHLTAPVFSAPLIVGGDLTIAGSMNFLLNGDSASGNYSFLSMAAGRSIILSSGSTFSVSLGSGFSSLVGETFTVASTSGGGSITGTFFNSQNSYTVGGYTFQASVVNNNITLTTTSAIPEPSTFAAIAGGLVLAGACLRRRRTRR